MQKCKIPDLLEPTSLTKIQKSGSTLLLGLLKGFQNGVSQPHSTKTLKEDRILRNGLWPDQEMVTSPNYMSFDLY